LDLWEGRLIKVTEQKYPSSFLNEVARAKERILLTDYDGVLAPFSRDRRGAFPFPGICDLLIGMMQCRTRLVVISGRPAHEVASFLAMQTAPEIWGNDGLERLYPDGRYECEDLNAPIDLLRALAECESELEQKGLKSLIEVKLTAVTVHWRGLTPSEKLETRTTAYRVLQPLTLLYPRLRVVAMEEGFELRLPVPSKADAVRRLLNLTPSNAPIAYLGHGVEDEDLFRTLNGRGLTVLVRPVQRFTAAQIRLRPPDELVRFLKDWISACDS
jgi:trehalose 6-phosphate phosphatase